MEDHETWEVAIPGKVAVWKYDTAGHLRQEIIASGRKFGLTKRERMLNQDRAANESLDMFKNGMLVPVRLIDEADEAEYAQNPNVLSETQMRELFKNRKGFASRIQEITNPLTLQRLLDMAEAEEATVPQVKALQAHLNEITGVEDVNEREQVSGPLGDDMRISGGVTPK